MTNTNEEYHYKTLDGARIPMSRHLKTEQKKFLLEMRQANGWQQIPMLAETIMLLTNKLDEADQNTTKYNTVLSILTVVMTVIAIMQFTVGIVSLNEPYIVRVILLIVTFGMIAYVLRSLKPLF